jgi:lauroyl/myristoyl acyltransferase
MQSKMASRSRWLNRFYQALLRVFIPLLRAIAKVLPLRLGYGAGRLVVMFFLLVRPKYLRALRANLAQILDESPGSKRVSRLARRSALNHARYWIDFFHWSERGSERASGAIRSIENESAFELCMGSGRGCILLTAHLGNWEMGGLLLGHRASEVAIIYVPDRFEAVEACRSFYRTRTGLTEIPLTNDPLSVLPALRILRSGGAVAVQGDRDFDNKGLPVPFFGREAYFPRGPAMLSLLSGAPILPVFILRLEDGAGAGSGGFRIVFLDPIEPMGDARDDQAVRSLVGHTVGAIETMVKEHPEQWYCFYPFWNDPTRVESRRESPSEDQSDRVAPTAAT